MACVTEEAGGTKTRILGDRAVVVGAGVGGIFAAGALRPYFREVVVLEKDETPPGAEFRKGVPQGPHGHIVLKRGENIAEDFFPGFRDRLREAGGIELTFGRDMARYAFGKWSASLDLGMTISSQTRPLLERVLRESLLMSQKVELRTESRFLGFLYEANRVRGVRIEGRDGMAEDLEADLVIDASGRATQTPRWLAENGLGEVETERIGIDLCYVTGIFATDQMDDGRPRLCTVGQTPPAVRGGTSLPVEGDRWMITLSGRGDDAPSLDLDGFLDYAKSLPDSCIYDRIAGGRLEGSLRRFKTPESFWRHYERMPGFPDGLIPIGDAVAGFNPIFGQGMSVAAIGAEALGLALEERSASGEGLADLPSLVLPKICEAIAEAWDGPATIDFLYSSTIGERPADYEQRRAIFFAMQEMAEDDDELQRAQFEVGNMLRSRTTLFSPDVVTRLQETLAANAAESGISSRREARGPASTRDPVSAGERKRRIE